MQKRLLETFQNDKAPGEDGFTVEFYKCFFEIVGNVLIASFNVKDELSISQWSDNNYISPPPPPKDGSLLKLLNWRPITLLKLLLEVLN